MFKYAKTYGNKGGFDAFFIHLLKVNITEKGMILELSRRLRHIATLHAQAFSWQPFK